MEAVLIAVTFNFTVGFLAGWFAVKYIRGDKDEH